MPKPNTLFLPVFLALALWSARAAPASWAALGPRLIEALADAGPWSGVAAGKALLGHLGAALAVAAGLAAAGGVGAAVACWLRLGSRGTGRLLVALASGFGVAAMAQHGLGLAGLFRGRLFMVEAGLAVAAGVWWLARLRPWQHVRRPADPWPVAVAAVLVAACFLLARLPDTHDDPRTYHFAAPESYLHEGKIHVEPLNVNWHMPLGAEMLDGVGWAYGDIEGAKLVNVAALLVLLLAAAEIAATLAAGSGGWAAVLVASAGLVGEECWQGKNDLALALFVAAAAWCAARAVAGRSRWWLGAGWFLGHAAAVKFTAGFAILGLAVGALAVRRNAARALPAALALGTLPFAGWLAESWLFLGNPVHPFLSSVLPDLGWGPPYQRGLSHVMLVLSPDAARTRADWVFGAWRAWADPVLGSPVLMTLAPLALLGARGPVAMLLRVAIAVGYLAWLPTERNARYLFPFLPLLAALAAPVAAGAGAGLARVGARALLVAGGVAALLAGAPHLLPVGLLRLAGQVDRDAVRLRMFTTWERERRWVNATVPARDRILFTGEERRLWFAPRVVSAFTVGEPLPWKLAGEAFTPAELRKRLRQRGLGWWLHNFVSMEYRALMRFPGPPWSDRALAVYAGFVRAYLEPAHAPDRVDHVNGGFWVFRIRSRPAGPFPAYFLPTTEGCFVPGYRLRMAGKIDEALAEVDRQAARMPGVMESILLAAKFYAIQENQPEVARRLAPVNASGFISDANFKHAAGAALHAGKYRTGVGLLAREIRLTGDADLYRSVAWAYLRSGQEELKRGRIRDAVRDLEQAAVCAPEQSAVQFEYARALQAAGRHADGLRWARRAWAQRPGDAELRALFPELGTP